MFKVVLNKRGRFDVVDENGEILEPDFVDKNYAKGYANMMNEYDKKSDESSTKDLKSENPNLVNKTYSPKGYSCSVDVSVTEDQAKALDLVKKSDEFGAYFWAVIIGYHNNGDMAGGDRVARIDGQHYIIGTESPTEMRGMGGRKHKIRFFNGDVVETTNLWHQGEIPDKLSSILPNNAEWVD